MNEKYIRKYQGRYSESKFSTKLTKVAKKAGAKLIYAVLLLYYVLQSPTLSKKDRTTILGALGYFIFPIDFLPDFIPVVGYADDLSALLLVIHAIWKNITPSVKAKAAARTRELLGDIDLNEIDKQLAGDSK